MILSRSYEVGFTLTGPTGASPMLVRGFTTAWEACQWASGAARLYPELYPGTTVLGISVGRTPARP